VTEVVPKQCPRETAGGVRGTRLCLMQPAAMKALGYGGGWDDVVLARNVGSAAQRSAGVEGVALAHRLQQSHLA